MHVDVSAWGWPQWIYFALCVAGVGLCFARHDKPKEGVYNGFSDFFTSCAIWALLVWGGFFA